MYAAPNAQRSQPYSAPPAYEEGEVVYEQPHQGHQPVYNHIQYQPQGNQYAQQHQHVQYENEYPQVNIHNHEQQQQSQYAEEGEFSGVIANGDGVRGDQYAVAGGLSAGDKLNYTPSNPTGNGWKDPIFIFLFCVHLLIMIILAGVYGPKMISDMKNSPPAPTDPNDEVELPKPNMFIAVMVVAALLGAVLSIGWLSVMKRWSSNIIHISLIASIGLAIAAMIVAFASSNPIMGVWFLIIGACTGLYYYFVRGRIPFATAILEASVASIQQSSGPIVVVYGLTLLNIGWLALWAFIFASVYNAGAKVESYMDNNGVVTQYRAGQTSGNQFLQAFCVLSLYWTCQVLKNIGHVTTAGVVASWWFIPSELSPTKPAFIRATTTSLGSIMFGSLLVALVETLRWSLQQARRNTCREIADCLLGCIDRALKFFNRYAYSTVAIYGLSFLDAAKRTGELFKAQLFTAVINDDLSGMVLFCGSFLSGTVAGIVGLLWAYGARAPGYVIFGICAWIVGFLVAALAMAVIQSAVTTTFVCWASEPAALLHNRPVEFKKILDAGQEKYADKGIQNYNGQPQQMGNQQI